MTYYASAAMLKYLEEIEHTVTAAYAVALKARQQSKDPESYVDIRLAKNMAERVEGLIAVVAPTLVNSGMTKRIIELEKQFSPMDWRVALKIAEEVSQGAFCSFPDVKIAAETGIRVGFAYHTGGIVAAPLEGFVGLHLKKTKDGKDYFAPVYAGPIRGAGGTAAAFSLIITDYVRLKLGYAPYDITPEEVQRYKIEIQDYHERVTNLQYFPSGEELEFLAQHLPIEIDGDPTEQIEVSNYKDIPRLETNFIRGGVCLVLAEGLSQKAQKIWKRLEQWGVEFGLGHWNFLKEFIALQKQIKARTATKKETQKCVTPNYTYINDLVAGRPILTKPMGKRGFRLRYGRTRCSGFSAASIHPATMAILKNYIAIGTQFKVERPGKAAVVTPCDTIEGPIVLLQDGSVVHLTTIEKAKATIPYIKRILYLGDILFNYGDFSENGHMLIPCGYNEEWWREEIRSHAEQHPGEWPADLLDKILASAPLTLREKIYATETYGLPLHPSLIAYWSLLTKEQAAQLYTWLEKGKIVIEEKMLPKIILPLQLEKALLEEIGVVHHVINNEYVLIQDDAAVGLIKTLQWSPESLSKLKEILQHHATVLDAINAQLPFKIRDKAGTFIGVRMGRPEKAKMRKLTGSPQVLFPIGEEGGRLRSIQSAVAQQKITADFPLYFCQTCQKDTIYQRCEVCDQRTQQKYYCLKCNKVYSSPCVHTESLIPYATQEIDIQHYLQAAMRILQMTVVPDLVKGVRGTSNKEHIPENLAKGILRAKHDLYVNKDGTIRFDMTEAPLTHFKPQEIGTSVSRLCQLGYTHDIYGQPLLHTNQILEIKPQDVVLPGSYEVLAEQADEVLVRVAHFVDELLVKFYGLEPYYNLHSKEDIIGHLVLGLAPHISSAVVGRIVGFSKTQVCYAHPLYHAAMRRDCDGDENCVILLMDALLNFSRKYLPNTRGAATMDAPLVLTPCITPSEVDDQAQGIDVVDHYQLAFYEAAQQFAYPWEVTVEQLRHRINTEKQYEGYQFTHHTTDICAGVTCSAYKELPSMEEKLKGQMELAELIDAVEARDVARLVIEKHFIKDARGNLRKFSQQQFRCSTCNEKYRRPPLLGVCTRCNGKIMFTVSEGAVIKYLEPSLSLAYRYDVSPYLKQTLEILKQRIESMFGKVAERQEGLGKWFG